MDTEGMWEIAYRTCKAGWQTMQGAFVVIIAVLLTHGLMEKETVRDALVVLLCIIGGGTLAMLAGLLMDHSYHAYNKRSLEWNS